MSYKAELCSTVSPESDDESHLQPPLKKTKRKFQPKWMEKWPWVRHNPEEDMFCATCREVPTLIINQKTAYLSFIPRIADSSSAFVKGTNNFSNDRNLKWHESSEKHGHCTAAMLAKNAPETAPIKRSISCLYFRRLSLTHQLCLASFLISQLICS